jgi:hypothetical protein
MRSNLSRTYIDLYKLVIFLSPVIEKYWCQNPEFNMNFLQLSYIAIFVSQ